MAGPDLGVGDPTESPGQNPETCSGEVINDPSVTYFTLKSNLISNLCLTFPPQVSVLPAG